MNTPHAASRTPFWTGRARKRAVAQDPADMGTCFGLEMTLGESDSAATPEKTLPRHWWQRLARGTRAAV
jgi:hypothetical protein